MVAYLSMVNVDVYIGILVGTTVVLKYMEILKIHGNLEIGESLKQRIC